MDVKKILEEVTKNNASDIFIVAGRPLTYKSKGIMETLNEIKMKAIGKLGMTYAAEGQIIYYTEMDDDYVRQVSDIPKK